MNEKVNSDELIFKIFIIKYRYIHKDILQVDYKISTKEMTKLFNVLNSCVFPVQMQSSRMKLG